MRLRTIAILLVLSLILGASAGRAAESRARVAQREEPGTAQSFNLVQQVRAYLVALWGDEGCRIDPWGRCVADQSAEAPPATGATSSVQAADADEGCIIDPWGCAATH